MKTNEELIDKIASFFEKEDNWHALKECWLENGRSNDLRRLLCKAINDDLSKVEENDLSVQ